MILKKDELEKEIFIYFSKEDFEECKIEVCDIKDIGGCIEKFKKHKNCRHFSKDSLYLLYFMYLKETEEILHIDILFEKKESLLNNLITSINNILSRNYVNAEVCVSFVIFDSHKASLIGRLVEIINRLRKRTLLFRNYKLNFKILDEIEAFTVKTSEKFINAFTSSKFLAILFLTYFTFYIFFLISIGIPLDLMNTSSLSIITETLTFMIFSFIAIIFTLVLMPTIFVPVIVTLVIFVLLRFIIYSFRRGKLVLLLNKEFQSKEILPLAKKFLVFIFGYFLFVLTIFLYIEPIIFFSEYTGLKLPVKETINKNFNSNVAKQEILRMIFTSNPDLRFVNINNTASLELGIKNDFVYYYKLEDVYNILQKSLKSKEETKKCYCEKLKDKKIKSTDFGLFHALFYIPTECGYYPYKLSLKDHLIVNHLSNTKLSKMDTNQISVYINKLKNLCNF